MKKHISFLSVSSYDIMLLFIIGKDCLYNVQLYMHFQEKGNSFKNVFVWQAGRHNK